MDRIVTALIEFHKAQCYFSSVIQVTALSLFHRAKVSIDNPMDTPSNWFDTSVLIVLATGGLIPINLTFSCLTRYGRQSWYLLNLSLITSTLATATLSASYYYAARFSDTYANNMAYDFSAGRLRGTCDLTHPETVVSLSQIVVPLCGNSNLVNNEMSKEIISNWWTWLVWTNCVVWSFFCLGKKCYDTVALNPYRRLLQDRLQRYRFTRFLSRHHNDYKVWIVIAVIPWSLCFASQFWLFAAYFQHSVISFEWSFGQIIAITVWLPCIIEYVYIEFRKPH